jgi:hypothetical protein
MGTEVVKSSLLIYFHYGANDSASPPITEDEYEIPHDAIQYVMRNSFAGNL